MDDQSQATSVLEAAYARLALLDGDPLRLDEPFRTVVLADTAIGLIGNGGFEYFFESDFPGKPDYGVFASAVDRLGLAYLADGLRELVALFPFPSPHQEKQLRLAYLAAPAPEFRRVLDRLHEQVWQDSSIDQRLQSLGAAA